jgi:uncharacterized protein
MPTTTTFETWFHARHPEVPIPGAHAVLRLAEAGATLPFMARYRKEQTGNLDEVAIQHVLEDRESWDALVKRQQFIVEEVERQKKLTPELRAQILGTFEASALEDIYLPFKQKRKTKAALAREAGLEPLAEWLWECGHGAVEPAAAETPEVRAAPFVNGETGIGDVQAALSGALEIVIERLSEDMNLRAAVRARYQKDAFVRTKKGDKAGPNSKFENYFQYEERVRELHKPESSHRYLAMRRGWMEEELAMSMGGATPVAAATPGGSGAEASAASARASDPLIEELTVQFDGAACSRPTFAGAPLLKKAARLALRVHVIPSIENELHKSLREVADLAAIHVFAENVRKLLLASPFGPKAVLGVDPGLRTGCKLAVVDDGGRYLGSTVIHLETPGGRTTAAQVLIDLVRKTTLRAVAVGNGTAGRETEAFVREALTAAGIDTPVVMVSEAGASVYSASEAAREEFPDLDVTVRGAISIARRLQDPLAELVKIDPKSIGVGQYQHDVSPAALKKSLEGVVDICVNQVGVNLNTASHHLLGRVSGIGPGLARAIVQRRSEKGLFRARTELLEVPRFSAKVFEQAAGFLRIPEGENPLDNTGVHPERYATLESLAQRLDLPVSQLLGAGVKMVRQDRTLEQELGAFTFADVVRELEKPGRDPRAAFIPFSFRADIHRLEDLLPDMVCPGIVTNVTNFGAFVDIGVHQDGLVHISQLADKFVKDPGEVVGVGDRVTVRVLEVKLGKQQIALTMKSGVRASAGGHAGRDPRGGIPGPRATGGDGTDRPPLDRARSDDRARGNNNAHRPATPPPPPVQKPFNNPFAGLGKLPGNLPAKPEDKQDGPQHRHPQGKRRPN